jgi:Excalibur calcium-binding domain
MQHELRSRRGRVLPVVFTALWVFTLIFAAPAFAQEDQFDCASFGSQEAAQAELERDPSDPSNLDADDDGIACEELSGGTEGSQDTLTGADLDCADFATQAEAQAEFDADTSDPNRLDADNDGIACEELDGASGASPQAGDTGGVNRQSADAFRCKWFFEGGQRCTGQRSPPVPERRAD